MKRTTELSGCHTTIEHNDVSAGPVLTDRGQRSPGTCLRHVIRAHGGRGCRHEHATRLHATRVELDVDHLRVDVDHVAQS